ncbi:protein that induces appearance of [PIN+] prion when overproduced [Neophaeococcomyces mojaviensis]|uniref:Protein that induces appearance of [PIN+] prion when overproduced n=1 Tax=Neophaeococcomyces mojaviensis TaxID=3383035 RepID=A0ACC3ACV1_9EURO|nr:protein that induces appearance of [PIN+] prion when overproduced [Knufia sp. JES_112]
MATATEAAVANANRSLRNIRNELEYLCDLSVISAQQLQSILAQLPAQTPLHAPIQSPVNGATTTPIDQFSSLNIKEHYSPAPTPAPLPPPAYPTGPSILSVALALYSYTPTDAGDLALQQNDRIQVVEHMNNDWWRGRNERTGLEGIFPRSYVNVVEEKRPPIPTPNPSEYGNMPLAMVQSDPNGRKPSKLEEHGKKFGKKMGNAAIFGAGATIGSNIVNGIF